MPISIKILAYLAGLILLLTFIRLIKKKTVKPFYSALWLLVTLFVISISVFEKFYKWISTLLGISDASFLIIVGLIFFLLIYVLYLSVKTSEMSFRIQELISHSSILENEIRKQKEELNKLNRKYIEDED